MLLGIWPICCDIIWPEAPRGLETGEGRGFEGDGAAVLFGVVVVLGVLLLLWPNSWANLTSFQMPTDEFTRKVETNVVIPAKAWSTLGKTWPMPFFVSD